MVLFSGKYTTKECSGYLKYGNLGMQGNQGRRKNKGMHTKIDKLRIIEIILCIELKKKTLVEEIQCHG